MGLGKYIRRVLSIRTTTDYIDESIKYLFLKKRRKLNAIDLGCGKGTYVINSFYNEYIEGCKLVDKFDKPYQEILDNSKTEFYSEDLVSFLNNTRSESVDFILAKDVLEHLTYEDSIVLLEQSYRVLNKDGILLVQVPNGSSPFAMRNFNNDLTHVQFLGHKSLKSLAGKVFKENVKVYPVAEFMRGKLYFVSGVIEKLILQPILQFIFSSSIHDSGKFFWSLNIMAINKKKN